VSADKIRARMDDLLAFESTQDYYWALEGALRAVLDPCDCRSSIEPRYHCAVCGAPHDHENHGR
jgi:hypothetical protein